MFNDPRSQIKTKARGCWGLIVQLANHLLQGDISIHRRVTTEAETFEYAFPHTAYWIWKALYADFSMLAIRFVDKQR
jgi:hypothetical protein